MSFIYAQQRMYVGLHYVTVKNDVSSIQGEKNIFKLHKRQLIIEQICGDLKPDGEPHTTFAYYLYNYSEEMK